MFLSAKRINKNRGLQYVWDSFPYKLLLHLAWGESLHHPTKAATGRPVYFAKLFYGDDEIEKIANNAAADQTLEVNADEKVVWNDPLLLLPSEQAVKSSTELFLVVFEKKRGLHSDRYCGKCSLGSTAQLLASQKDVVHSMLLQLQAWGSSASKRSKGVNPRAQINVRLLVSTAAETRPMRLAASTLYDFPYRAAGALDKMKTGDLLAFSGHGVLPAAIEVLTARPYSSVGLVVRLQNKYTFFEELYVLEFSRNVDSMLDAYRDVPLALMLTRVKDRLHQFHGTSIFHVPLGTPLFPEESQHLVELVCDLHNTQAHPSRDQSSLIVASMLSFLRSVLLYEPKTSAQVAEIYSASIVVRLLHQATCMRQQQDRPPLFSELEQDTLVRIGSPARLVQSSCFLAPVPLRVPRATKAKPDLRRQASVYQPGTDRNNLRRQPGASRTQLDFPRDAASPMVQPSTPQRDVDTTPPRDAATVAATSLPQALPASFEPTVVTFELAKKTTSHWAFGVGCDDCFVVHGLEGPILTLTIDQEYIFHVKTPGHQLYLTRSKTGGPADAADHRHDIWEDSTDSGRFLFIPSYAMPQSFYYQSAAGQCVGGEIHLRRDIEQY